MAFIDNVDLLNEALAPNIPIDNRLFTFNAQGEIQVATAATLADSIGLNALDLYVSNLDADLNSQLLNIRNQADQVSLSITQLETDLSLNMNGVQANTNSIIQTQNSLSLSDDAIDANSALLAGVQTSINTIQQDVDGNTVELSGQSQSLLNLTSRVTQSEDEIEASAQLIAGVQSEVEATQLDINGLGQTVTANSQSVLNLQSTSSANEDGVQALGQAYLGVDGEVTDINTALGKDVSGNFQSFIDLQGEAQANTEGVSVNTQALIGVNGEISDVNAALGKNATGQFEAFVDLQGQANSNTEGIDVNVQALVGVNSTIDNLNSDTRTVIRSTLPPTLRPSGEPLQEGDLWVNTTVGADPDVEGKVSSWNGVDSWIPFEGALRNTVSAHTDSILALDNFVDNEYVQATASLQSSIDFLEADPGNAIFRQNLAPTKRGVDPDGLDIPLVAGDLWVNTTIGADPDVEGEVSSWNGVDTWVPTEKKLRDAVAGLDISVKGNRDDLDTIEAQAVLYADTTTGGIASINLISGQAGNQISINADQLNITATTTFNNGTYKIQDSVDAAETGAINSARDNVALRLGYADYADMETKAIAGDTVINGGKIRSTLLDVDLIFAEDAVIGGLLSMGDYLKIKSDLMPAPSTLVGTQTVNGSSITVAGGSDYTIDLPFTSQFSNLILDGFANYNMVFGADEEYGQETYIEVYNGTNWITLYSLEEQWIQMTNTHFNVADYSQARLRVVNVGQYERELGYNITITEEMSEVVLNSSGIYTNINGKTISLTDSVGGGSGGGSGTARWNTLINNPFSTHTPSDFADAVHGHSASDITDLDDWNLEADTIISLRASTTNTYLKGIQFIEGTPDWGTSNNYGMRIYYEPDANIGYIEMGNQTTINTAVEIFRNSGLVNFPNGASVVDNTIWHGGNFDPGDYARINSMNTFSSRQTFSVGGAGEIMRLRNTSAPSTENAWSIIVGESDGGLILQQRDNSFNYLRYAFQIYRDRSVRVYNDLFVTNDISGTNAEFSGALDVAGDATVLGNVGIGTTSPVYKLHVEGGAVRFDNGLASTSPIDVLDLRTSEGSENQSSQLIAMGRTSYWPDRGIEFGYDPVATWGQEPSFIVNAGGNTALRVKDNGDVNVPNGNVGIGTASPDYTLDVNGAGRFTSNLYVEGGLFAKEFIVDQTRVMFNYQLSSGGGKISTVSGSAGSEVITFEDENGAGFVPVALNDILHIQKRTGFNSGAIVKNIYRRVSSITGNNVTLTTTGIAWGTVNDIGSIVVGDDIYTYGSTSNVDRDGRINFDVSSTPSPAMRLLDDITDVGAVNEIGTIGWLGGVDTGAFGTLPNERGFYLKKGYIDGDVEIAGNLAVTSLPRVSDEGLVGLWRFDNSCINSVSGDAPSTIDEPSFVSGISGTAADFNGTSNRLTYSNFEIESDTILISFWMDNQTHTNETRNTVCDFNGDGRFIVVKAKDGVDRIAFYDGSDWREFSASHYPSGTELECVTLWVKPTEVTLFLNGDEKQTVSKNTGTYGTASLSIGSYVAPQHYLLGKLDEFRIQDVSSFTETEIQNQIKSLYLYPSGNSGGLISANQVRTGMLESQNRLGGGDGSPTTSGFIADLNAGWLSGPEFALGSDGSALFGGELSAATGTFSGELFAVIGSFKGSVDVGNGAVDINGGSTFQINNREGIEKTYYSTFATLNDEFDTTSEEKTYDITSIVNDHVIKIDRIKFFIAAREETTFNQEPIIFIWVEAYNGATWERITTKYRYSFPTLTYPDYGGGSAQDAHIYTKEYSVTFADIGGQNATNIMLSPNAKYSNYRIHIQNASFDTKYGVSAIYGNEILQRTEINSEVHLSRDMYLTNRLRIYANQADTYVQYVVRREDNVDGVTVNDKVVKMYRQMFLDGNLVKETEIESYTEPY